jgi:hypothetical protein
MKKKFLELSAQDLMTLTAYAHWIPMTRQLYWPYLEKNFPGWEWNQIIPVLIKKKILVMHSKNPGHRHLSQDLYISSDIQYVRLWINNGETEVATD